MMDVTGLVALESIVDTLRKKHIMLVISNLAPRIRRKLQNAGIGEQPGAIRFVATLDEASRAALTHTETQAA